MSLWIVVLWLVASAAQPMSPQLNDNSTTDNIVFNSNNTISVNDTDAQPPGAPSVSHSQSSASTNAPTTKNESCLNTEGWTFGASVKYTCDDDFVWCSDPGAMENCCKCKASCCSYCKTRNHAQDPYRPCQYKPSMRPTSVSMPISLFSEDEIPPSENKIGRLELGLIIGASAFILLLILVTVMIRTNVRQRREILNLRRTMAERRRNSPSSDNSDDEVSSARDNRIRLSFFFDTVLPDKSNANAVSLRSFRDVMEASENDTHSATTTRKSMNETGPEEGPQVIKRQQSNSSASTSIPDLRKTLSLPKRSQRSLRNVFSSWRKQSSDDECSICLECYKPGEAICVAIADTCNHVFHKACLVEWLKNHDCCPLCRVNLLLEMKK